MQNGFLVHSISSELKEKNFNWLRIRTSVEVFPIMQGLEI